MVSLVVIISGAMARNQAIHGQKQTTESEDEDVTDALVEDDKETQEQKQKQKQKAKQRRQQKWCSVDRDIRQQQDQCDYCLGTSPLSG